MATERELALVEAALKAAAQQTKKLQCRDEFEPSFHDKMLKIAEDEIRSLNPAAIIASVPQPTEQPEDDTSQDWEKLDGATAYHLIERHADDWNEARSMMETWGRARFAEKRDTLTPAPQIGRNALQEFVDKFCLGDSRLIACAEAAHYAFNNSLAGESQAPQDHIPDAGEMVPQRVELTDEMIHAAQSAWIDGHAPNYDGTAEALRRALLAAN